MVEEAEIQEWIAEMNGSYPALRLTREDVIYANCGLVPFGDTRTAAGELSFGKESRYVDHRAQGIAGLVTLIGIRYTTARGDAARALDLLLEQMPNAPSRAATESTPLVGGDIANFAALESAARREVAGAVAPDTLEAWLRNYGTEYRTLAKLARMPGQADAVGNSATVVAEITHAVEDEMAMHVEDVILRRTNLGSGSHPGSAAIEAAALAMQPLLGWTEDARRAEVAATEAVLEHHSGGSAEHENSGDGRHGVHRLEARARCASPWPRDRGRRPIEFRARTRALQRTGTSGHLHASRGRCRMRSMRGASARAVRWSFTSPRLNTKPTCRMNISST